MTIQTSSDQHHALKYALVYMINNGGKDIVSLEYSIYSIGWLTVQVYGTHLHHSPEKQFWNTTCHISRQQYSITIHDND